MSDAENPQQPKSKSSVGSIVARVVLLTLVALLLTYNVYVIVMRYARGVKIPTVFGYAAVSVLTGSMEPEISPGDMVVIHRQDAYSVGDIITFYDDFTDVHVTHRIVRVEDDNYITQGDSPNNNAQEIVPKNTVVGKVVAILPFVGRIVEFLRSPLGLLSIVIIIGAVWLILWLLRGDKSKNAERS